MPAKSPARFRRIALHLYRVGIFALLLFLIRHQHARFLAQREGNLKSRLTPAEVTSFFPEADSLGDWDAGHGGQNVFDTAGKKLGHVIQTSPEAANIHGFSGPTNSMIAFDTEGRILGIKILESDDTREHLAQVKKDDRFLKQWNGLARDEAAALREFHIVSGATLTSTAITEGVTTRLGGVKKPRFPAEIAISEVEPFLPGAASLESVEQRPFLRRVVDSQGQSLGFVSRTSPHADHMTGYQGPTDVLIVLDPREVLIGLAIRDTFDNQPYVSYLAGDEYFFNTFKGFTLAQIGEIDIVESGIDVVSGATKTSVTVAEGLIHSALEIAKERQPAPPRSLVQARFRDYGTVAMTVLGAALGFSRLRGNRKLRLAFQILLVGYLGFINADLLSQALLVGWAKNGVAWQVAPGLVFLSAAALLAPIFTGKNVYCGQLCPFGAAQDLLRGRLPWKLSVTGKLEKALSALPALLLLWCLIIVLGRLPFSLVGLEPFDAFVFRVAGWATLAVAVTGLLASALVNRAYCRYGCPTGAMLKFLRFGGAAGEKFGTRDVAAAGFALLALALAFWSR